MADLILRACNSHEQLRKAVKGLLSIVYESEGVAGYHLNGTVATWDEFNFEVGNAEMALAAAEARSPGRGESS